MEQTKTQAYALMKAFHHSLEIGMTSNIMNLLNLKNKMNENLSITEWLQKLPEPYRTQALNNTELYPYPGAVNETLPSLFMAVSLGFVWHQSQEGVSYWSDVHARAERGEFN